MILKMCPQGCTDAAPNTTPLTCGDTGRAFEVVLVVVQCKLAPVKRWLKQVDDFGFLGDKLKTP